MTIAPRKLGHVVLKVRDLERAEAFYAGVLGLSVTGRLPGRMVFFAAPGNPDSHDLAVYRVGADAAPQGREQVGLFHLAYQVESREALEAAYHHLKAHGVKITGTMNHGAKPLRLLRGPRWPYGGADLRGVPRGMAAPRQFLCRPRSAPV